MFGNSCACLLGTAISGPHASRFIQTRPKDIEERSSNTQNLWSQLGGWWWKRGRCAQIQLCTEHACLCLNLRLSLSVSVDGLGCFVTRSLSLSQTLSVLATSLLLLLRFVRSCVSERLYKCIMTFISFHVMMLFFLETFWMRQSGVCAKPSWLGL